MFPCPCKELRTWQRYFVVFSHPYFGVVYYCGITLPIVLKHTFSNTVAPLPNCSPKRSLVSFIVSICESYCHIELNWLRCCYYTLNHSWNLSLNFSYRISFLLKIKFQFINYSVSFIETPNLRLKCLSVPAQAWWKKKADNKEKGKAVPSFLI